MTVFPATGCAHDERSAPYSAVMLGLALALSIALAGCSRGHPSPKNLLLVTIDTLRSDRLGTYGNPIVLTPNLDRLAARGTLFCDASAQIPSTLPSHASILTGRYPTTHGVHDNGVYFLDERESTLAEMLGEIGLEGAAFVGAFVLDHRFGTDQGFAVYDDRMEDPLRRGEAPRLDDATNPVARWWVGSWFSAYQRRGDSVVRAAAQWLRQRPARDDTRPFFLWVHLFDPHEPYDPPFPFAALYDRDYNGPMDGTGEAFEATRAAGTLTERDVAHMRSRYDSEVTYADACLGALLDSIEALGVLDETLVAVTADHGEGLGEHDYYFEHGSRLWETLLRVPLILSGPGVPSGLVVTGRVRSVDIAPTLTELLGVPAPAGIDGASLRPLFESEADARDSYAETQCGLQTMPVPESYRALSSGDWKLIAVAPRNRDAAGAPSVALYDLARDAGETRDLSAERPRIAQDLLSALARTAAAGRRDSIASLNTRAMDDETVAKLRALGYVQ